MDQDRSVLSRTKNRIQWPHRARIWIAGLIVGLPVLHTAFPIGEQDKASLEMSVQDLDGCTLEAMLFDLTNRERAGKGLSILAFNDSLRLAAGRHSLEMATIQYLSHTSPISRNRTLKDRLENAGIKLKNVRIGENIAVDFVLDIAGVPYWLEQRNGETVAISSKSGKRIVNQKYEQFAGSTVTSWMESQGHRENILHPEHTEMGIGIAQGRYKGLDAVYVTQVFRGRIKPTPSVTKGLK